MRRRHRRTAMPPGCRRACRGAYIVGSGQIGMGAKLPFAIALPSVEFKPAVCDNCRGRRQFLRPREPRHGDPLCTSSLLARAMAVGRRLGNLCLQQHAQRRAKCRRLRRQRVRRHECNGPSPKRCRRRRAVDGRVVRGLLPHPGPTLRVDGPVHWGRRHHSWLRVPCQERRGLRQSRRVPRLLPVRRRRQRVHHAAHHRGLGSGDGRSLPRRAVLPLWPMHGGRRIVSRRD